MFVREFPKFNISDTQWNNKQKYAILVLIIAIACFAGSGAKTGRAGSSGMSLSHHTYGKSKFTASALSHGKHTGKIHSRPHTRAKKRTPQTPAAINTLKTAAVSYPSGAAYIGNASWYGAKFQGRKTAAGEIFDKNKLTAAHRTMPLPSYACVTNLENGASLVVRVNDRGPYVHNRIIDVSQRAAQLLGYHRGGLAKVRVEYLRAAPKYTDDRDFLRTAYHSECSKKNAP